MKDRIRKIRKEAGLTQKQFGAILGVAQTTIAGYENGSREIPNSAIVSICREFLINDKWLRSGEGPMHQENIFIHSVPPELTALIGKFLQMDPAKQKEILSVAEEVIRALKKEYPASESKNENCAPDQPDKMQK